MPKIMKALIVRPEKRPDSDLGDVVALARAIGKKLSRRMRMFVYSGLVRVLTVTL